ncbi:hypothetical protein HK405_000435, partial [Cladochytrium tenue]
MADTTRDTDDVFADAEGTPLRFAVTRGPHREKTRVLIEKHGGAVVEPHEGNLYARLAAPGTSHSDHNLYSYEYVQACIEAGDLLDLEPYSLDRRGSKVIGAAPKAPKRTRELFNSEEDQLIKDTVLKYYTRVSMSEIVRECFRKNSRHNEQSWRARITKIIIPKMIQNGELRDPKNMANPARRATSVPPEPTAGHPPSSEDVRSKRGLPVSDPVAANSTKRLRLEQILASASDGTGERTQRSAYATSKTRGEQPSKQAGANDDSIDSNDRPILGVLEKVASKAPRSGTAALSPVPSNSPEIPTRKLPASAMARRPRQPVSDDDDFVEASENAYPLPPHAAAERRTRSGGARTLLVEDSEEGSPPQETVGGEGFTVDVGDGLVGDDDEEDDFDLPSVSQAAAIRSARGAGANGNGREGATPARSSDRANGGGGSAPARLAAAASARRAELPAAASAPTTPWPVVASGASRQQRRPVFEDEGSDDEEEDPGASGGGGGQQQRRAAEPASRVLDPLGSQREPAETRVRVREKQVERLDTAVRRLVQDTGATVDDAMKAMFMCM